MAEPARQLFHPEDDENRVYDPNSDHANIRPNLRKLEGGESQPGSAVSDDGRSIPKEDLKSGEESAGSSEEGASFFRNEGDSSTGSFQYNREKQKGRGRVKGRLKKLSKHKWLLGLGGLGAIGGLIALILLILTLGSLLIPNFAQNMIAYQFARSTRETVASNNEVTSEKAALDSTSDSAFKNITAKYKNLKDSVWSKINKYRPDKVVENLRGEGQLYYEYSPPTKILGRRTLQTIIVNSNYIDVPQNSTTALDKILHPINYTKDLFQSNKLLKTNLADTLDTTFHGTNYIIRSQVAKTIRKQIDVKLYRWSNQDIAKAQGENNQTGDIANAQQSYKIATDDGKAAAEAADGSKGKVKEVAQEAEQNVEQCVQSNTCIKQVVTGGGGMPSQVINILTSAFKSSIWDSVINFIGPTYAVAAPLCMIYQGSIVNSGGVINANSAEDERTGYSIASAASQQQAGAVNGEVVGALSRQMGGTSDITQSNVMQRASGEPVDTSATISPQAAANGTTDSADILDSIPGGGGLRHVIGPLCSVFDNVYTGVGIGVLTLLTPGVGEAVKGGQVTVTEVTKLIASRAAESIKNMFTKQELAKLAVVSGATVGGAFLAKWLTLQHMAAVNNGLSQGKTYLDQADAGMNLMGQDIDRQQNYGAPMTDADTAQVKSLDAAYLTKQDQSKSFYQRYFAASNPSSLVNKVGVVAMAHVNLSSFSSFFSSAARIFNPVTAFSSVFSIFQSKSATVAAAGTTDTTDYGNVQIGWTQKEEDAYENDPDYSMLNNQQVLDQSGQESNIESDYGKCFTDTMGELLANKDIQRNSDGDVLPDKGDCSPDNLGMNNPKYGNLVFRWRVSKRNLIMTNQLLDTQNATPVQ